jgi:hypothetical protein
MVRCGPFEIPTGFHSRRKATVFGHISPDDLVRNVRAVADLGSPVLEALPSRPKSSWWRRLFRR